LKLIAMTIKACRVANKPVAVCGEIAGNPSLTRMLLGMGLTEFSMHPASLLKVKQEVLLSNVKLLKPKANKLLGTEDPQRIALALKRLHDSSTLS
jgi:phosphoenolpyruvate-protein phosphotransferase (PTS system enzyme I)